MEWLNNLLGFSNQGSSPFGAFGGGSGASGGYSGPWGNMGNGTGVGPTGPIPASANPSGGGGMQLPGIWGQMMGQQQGAQGQQGQQNNSMSPQQQFLLNQAFGLIKGPQLQPAPMMNLLSGPGAR
jgi:hypothetical protein